MFCIFFLQLNIGILHYLFSVGITFLYTFLLWSKVFSLVLCHKCNIIHILYLSLFSPYYVHLIHTSNNSSTFKKINCFQQLCCFFLFSKYEYCFQQLCCFLFFSKYECFSCIILCNIITVDILYYFINNLLYILKYS